jgi:diketogulonate reductase-like aldo/keto reductase
MADFDVVPAVDQVEWHPLLFQKELYDFYKANVIQQEAKRWPDWMPWTATPVSGRIRTA